MLGVKSVLIACVCVSSCARQPERPVAEASYRAFKKIAGATAMGVNKLGYDALLQEAATELLVLTDLQSSGVDSATLQLYVSALDKYKDAGSLWAEKIDDARYDWIPKGRIYLTNSSMASRYGLQVDTHKMPYTGSRYETVPETSIQQIWLLAEADADSASRTVIARLRSIGR